jgi:hypothetical protein
VRRISDEVTGIIIFYAIVWNNTFASAWTKRQEQRDDRKRKECVWEKVATPLEYVLLRYNSSAATPRPTTVPKLRPKFPCENSGLNYCINIIKILFRSTFPAVAQGTPFLSFNRKTNSLNPPRPAGGAWHGPHSSKIFVLFCVLFVLCCSMYCLCVNVYCITATGWQPNCS